MLGPIRHQLQGEMREWRACYCVVSSSPSFRRREKNGCIRGLSGHGQVRRTGNTGRGILIGCDARQRTSQYQSTAWKRRSAGERWEPRPVHAPRRRAGVPSERMRRLVGAGVDCDDNSVPGIARNQCTTRKKNPHSSKMDGNQRTRPCLITRGRGLNRGRMGQGIKVGKDLPIATVERRRMGDDAEYGRLWQNARQRSGGGRFLILSAA